MELKRNMSSSNLSSASASSDVMDTKRRATPSEDSPIAQIYNDVGIHKVVEEAKIYQYLIDNGKKFLNSLQGIRNDSPEESADDIYKRARQIWEFKRNLVRSCNYGIKKDSSLAHKLVSYSNEKTAAERVNSMKEDPWMEYILGDRVLGTKKKSAILRGFLSIFIAYWNMEDLIKKYKLGTYQPSPTAYCPPKNLKRDKVIYVIEHVKDFRNLKEVVYSKYGSDPDLAAKVFEKISKYQVEKMDLRNTWIEGKRAMIDLALHSQGSSTPAPCGVYLVRGLSK
ncbi:hypothetical protein CASFOL_039108 [Castilleja foliolosa]|uniref:Uncharacterized protein n=1 Tax=Castilleja foliolosa TaxID=1961234 RepID=A0ABD3BHN1_9LAMI